jgi:hypothetical protein
MPQVNITEWKWSWCYAVIDVETGFDFASLRDTINHMEIQEFDTINEVLEFLEVCG